MFSYVPFGIRNVFCSSGSLFALLIEFRSHVIAHRPLNVASGDVGGFSVLLAIMVHDDDAAAAAAVIIVVTSDVG